MEKKKKVLIIGVIGADVHAVGNKILYHAFTEAGFDVVNLGVMVSQEEYIAAAIEANADAIERGVLALDVTLGDAPEGAYVRDWSINGVVATLSVAKA